MVAAWFSEWDAAMWMHLAIIMTTAFGSALLLRRVQRARFQYALAIKLSTIQETLDELDDRLGTILPVALDFCLSLGPDGTAALYEVQELSSTASKFADEVRIRIESGEPARLREAQALLEAEGESFGPGSRLDGVVPPTPLWESRIRSCIDLLTERVRSAREGVHKAGVPLGLVARNGRVMRAA